MKYFSIKCCLIFLILLFIFCINAHYEIFAINCRKGKGNVKEEGTFRVMTYNVNASNRIDDIEKFKSKLIEEIDRQKPDILCLQELSVSNFRKIQTSLDSVFGYTDTMIIKKEPLRYWIYSKKPIRKFKKYQPITEIDTIGFNLSSKQEIKKIRKQMPFFSAEIEVEGNRWITIFACHLMSSAYSTARRKMGDRSLWIDGLPTYYNNYKIGEKIRKYEADNLKIYLDSSEIDNNAIIIAGDFNDWSGSYSLENIKNYKYKDAWWSGGLGFGFTYNAWHLSLRLDHILYSSNIELRNVHVEKSELSDHYLLISDFELKFRF